MPAPAARALCLLLALLLSGVAAPGCAVAPAGQPLSLRQGQAPPPAGSAKNSVRIPSLLVAPGTPEEHRVWLAEGEGPLAHGEALQREEVRALLSAVAARSSSPALASVARKLGEARHLEEWEWKLWRDYLAYVGQGGVSTRATRQDMRPSAEDRRDMALRIALGALLPGMSEQLAQDASLQNVAFLLMGALTTYLVLWAAPEPLTKVAALGVTLTLLAAFGAKLLVHVVNEWKVLAEDTRQARTFVQVKAAGLRFGRELGADGARVLFVLASLALGHRAGPLLQKLPPPSRPGATWVAELPGGVRVALAQVRSIAVVEDTVIITLGAGAGGTVVAPGLSQASGQGGSSGGDDGSPSPSSEKLAANMEAAGIPRPPGTAAHHIVAGNAPAAEPARAVLRRFGIGINDAANGVFLPARRKAPGTPSGATHSTLHTEEYYRAVNETLELARSRQDALMRLDDIRRRLLSDEFPAPRH